MYQDSRVVLVKVEGEDDVVISYTKYPLKGYGNHVTTYIALDRRKNKVKVWMRWDGWAVGGSLTGSRVEAEVEVTPEIADAFSKVRTPEDFIRLQKMIETLEEEKEEELDRALGELVDRICELAGTDETLKNIESLKSMSKEELKEWLLEYFADP